MTPTEAKAFNAGVLAVLDIAARTAAAITCTSKRHVHEDFAVAALSELAEAGRTLLIRPAGDAAAPAEPATSPTPTSGSASLVAA